MMRRAPLIIAALAASPAMAQDAGDKVRIDEFALPAATDGVAAQQVDPDASALRGDNPAPDRRIAPSDAGRTGQGLAVGQLARKGQALASTQVNGPQPSRTVSPAAISSASDSRPEAATRLQGEDRCDPQSDIADQQECRRILELRASEFQAAEAPRLSAEQALLAHRGESAGMLAGTSSGLRLRIAGGNDPDAQIRANQEIAAIYLGNTPGAAVPQAETPAEAGIPDGLAEAIELIQQQAALAGQP